MSGNPAAAGTASVTMREAIPICFVDDVPFGEGRSIALVNRRIGVFHTPQGFFAIDNDCPHQGGPLSDGIVADACVTCPLHGRRIDLTTGQVQGHDEQVKRYSLEIRDGKVWLLPGTGFQEP
ncbi:MAG: nitrite reductase (NAD(P)H) small subunit [Actinobacteria bacterium]|nr:nitrite reductase (NAD(P)H) small subunit [Actinomycetota bacterium]